jgi:hypothetical protein
MPISVAQTIYERGRPDHNNFSQRLQNWMNTLRLNEGVLQGNNNDNDNEIQEQDPEEVADICQHVRIVQGQENSNQWIAQYLGGGTYAYEDQEYIID